MFSHCMDPFYGHRHILSQCAKFITHLFTCLELQSSSSGWVPYFIVYTLHLTKLVHTSVTFVALILLQLDHHGKWCYCNAHLWWDAGIADRSKRTIVMTIWRHTIGTMMSSLMPPMCVSTPNWCVQHILVPFKFLTIHGKPHRRTPPEGTSHCEVFGFNSKSRTSFFRRSFITGLLFWLWLGRR